MTENPRVLDGDRPTAEQIATRIDLGMAEYHDTCCPWLLSTTDDSLFTSVQACECGGPEMAKAYVELSADLDAALAWRDKRAEEISVDLAALVKVRDAAAAILRPARGDASWLHTVEFDDLRAALEAVWGGVSTR